MPNGLMEWQPLNDDEVTLGRVWGVLGLLMERTKVLPTLVTQDQCRLNMAQSRERTNEELESARKQRGRRRFTALLVVLSCFLTSVLTVAGAMLILRTGG